MSDIEISESESQEQQLNPSEMRRRSRLGLGLPKKLVMKEPEVSDEEDAEGLEGIERAQDEDEFDEPVVSKTKKTVKMNFNEEPEEEQEEPEEEQKPKEKKSKKEKKAEKLKKKAEKLKKKALKTIHVIDEEEDQEEKPKTVILEMEDEVIEEEEEPKPTNPKGKYNDMTLKQLQTLTKERNVAGRSALKNREAIIAKLEELDASPQVEEQPKPKNKYSSMTITELKKLMGQRNIVGRSTVKTKDAMISKLLIFDENPNKESEPKFNGKGLGKGGFQRHKPEKVEEDPQDEEVNKKVTELVNKIYKMKKHAKKQSEEFKNGFMEYIQDLSKLVDDYHESCN